MIELDLNQFNINKVMNQIENDVGDYVNALGLKGLTSLIYKTPVGNPSLWKSKPPKGYVGGQARFSWNIRHGKPDLKLPKKWSASFPALPSLSNKGYEPLYLSSSLPYIIPLEEGWSSQGSHMVARTFNELRYSLTL